MRFLKTNKKQSMVVKNVLVQEVFRSVTLKIYVMIQTQSASMVVVK